MRTVLILALIFCYGTVSARFRADQPYPERPDTKPAEQASRADQKAGVRVGFTSADIRYEKNKNHDGPLKKTWSAKGWRGEKVHTQLLIRTSRAISRLHIEKSGLTDEHGHRIPATNIRADFVRYVLADGLNAKGSGCGIPAGHDSAWVADMIDTVRYTDLTSGTVQPVWLSIRIPATTAPGLYRGYLTVRDGTGKQLTRSAYTVEVVGHTLPEPKHWKYHLDLWQNPDAIARIHRVKKWSPEHFALLRPYMKMLANAGQKSITATLIHDPWNSQTYDVYDAMIKWTKTRNGSWRYDYTVFDQWTCLMMSLGIDKLINCYSMIPWNLKFYYYDETLGRDTFLVARPGTPAYDAHWRPMLADLAVHLKAKGWLGKASIAMDERPLADMQQAIALIRSADKDLKISLAGNYHPQIQADLADLSVASDQVLDGPTLRARQTNGSTTTFYTCCTEGAPNTFTFSAPAEAAWLAWYAAAKGYDGYLRWAFNSWPAAPLRDSRFGSWSAGDTFLIYPGPRSSIRFERLTEGIQDHEKIRILQAQFSKQGQLRRSEKLERALADFDLKNVKDHDPAKMVRQAQAILNSF